MAAPKRTDPKKVSSICTITGITADGALTGPTCNVKYTGNTERRGGREEEPAKPPLSPTTTIGAAAAGRGRAAGLAPFSEAFPCTQYGRRPRRTHCWREINAEPYCGGVVVVVVVCGVF